MTDRKTVPKKKKVGSLFFHLFNRMSLWLYTLLLASFPAKLLTSYNVLERRWSEICLRVFGAPDGKFKRFMHRLRLRCASLIEHSLILHAADRIIRFFIYCPINVYGMFFFVYGTVSAAVYFIAERLSVSYAGNIGWGIAGIVVAFASLPLLCTSKTLYRAAFGSRVIGKVLRLYLGLERTKAGNERKERGGTLMVYAALILGALAGAFTFFFHPAAVPIAALVLVLAITVLYIPESGILLAACTICIWWMTGYPVLCAVAIASVTLISYAFKIVRGRRVIKAHLLDSMFILLVGIFALHGVLIGSNGISVAYGLGYAILIAMYFPTVNLMRSGEWLNRCYRLLSFSGAVLAVLSVLPVAKIMEFLDMTVVRMDLSALEQLFLHYDSYFGKGTMVVGMLMLLLPIMLGGLFGKRTISGVFWKVLCIAAACVTVFLSMGIGVWAGFVAAMLLFFFTYSYRSLSATMLVMFPVACGAVWHKELDMLFGIRHYVPVRAVMDTISVYVNSAAYRQHVTQSVLQLLRDNLLGVGFGDATVQSALANYAVSGTPAITEISNTYLQLLAECGVIGVTLLACVLGMYMLSVLTYLRWGGNAISKARACAGFASIGGLFVMGFSCNLMNNASLFGLFWLVVGLTVANLRTQYETHVRAVYTHSATGERSDIAFRTR